MWCLESYSPVQPTKDVFQTNSRVWNLSGFCLDFVWNLSGIFWGFQTPDNYRKLQTNYRLCVFFCNLAELNDLRPKSKFQTNSRVWNLSGIFCSCLEFENPRKFQTTSRQIPDSGICLESLICNQSRHGYFKILVPRATPGIVRDSNDREVLTE